VPLKGEVWLGEPDSPKAETDMRRRWWAWALAAAAAMGPGKADTPPPAVGERPNISVSFWPDTKDERRGWEGDGGGEFSEGMVVVVVVVVVVVNE
jgi:hypothetical protein